MDKCHLLSLVKIRLVTDGIFLIWADVARTNIACTNVTVTVGLCSRWLQKPNFKIGSVTAEIIVEINYFFGKSNFHRNYCWANRAYSVPGGHIYKKIKNLH